MSVQLDIKGVVSLKNQLTSITAKLKQLPKEAHKEFVKNTPVRTGNARNNTRLNGDTIEASYAYAGVLDKGRHMTPRGMRGSDQAPKGMTKPTVDFIKKRVQEIVRGK